VWQTSAFGAVLDVVIDLATRGALYAWALDGPAALGIPFLESMVFTCTHAVRFHRPLTNLSTHFHVLGVWLPHVHLCWLCSLPAAPVNAVSGILRRHCGRLVALSQQSAGSSVA